MTFAEYQIEISGNLAVVPLSIHRKFVDDAEAIAYCKRSLHNYYPSYWRAELWRKEGNLVHIANFIMKVQVIAEVTKVHDATQG